MKPTGPKYERETVIVFDDENNTGTLWTASGVIYRKMIRLGWELIEEGERHGVFRFPRTAVKLPRAKRKSSKPVGFAKRAVIDT